MSTPSVHETPSAKGMLQRCGGPSCACEGHDDEPPLMRSRSFGNDPESVPPIVGEALRSSGPPLDEVTRSFFEQRFGHDFGEVRVHTGAPAADSARMVNALAYTVGTDLVFGMGAYSPGTVAGRRLLAHELTHVVQQGGHSAKAPLPSSISPSFDPLEEEADRVAEDVESETPLRIEENAGAGFSLHRQSLSPVQLSPSFGPVQQTALSPTLLSPTLLPPSPLQAGPLPALPKLQTPAIHKSVPAACDHHAPLTWADFSATPPAKGGFSAKTFFNYDLATVGSVTLVKAFFDSTKSWVKPQFTNPSNPAVSGCDKIIGQCQAYFTKQATAGATGGSFSPNPPGAGAKQCPASFPLQPTVTATDFGKCASVLGQHCADVAGMESDRLLRHEQRHYDLACALASKGTLAIMGGAVPADMLKAVRSVSASQTSKYDHETAHGCKPGPQATWSRDIDAGLPAVKVP